MRTISTQGHILVVLKAATAVLAASFSWTNSIGKTLADTLFSKRRAHHF